MPEDVTASPAAPVAPSAVRVESSTGLSPRLAATLAYLGWWITGLLFWALERRDGYIRHHAAQSVVVFGIVSVFISAFCVLAVASLSFFPSAFAPFLWAAAITWIAGLLLWVLAMWKASSGQAWRMPIASELADRMNGSR